MSLVTDTAYPSIRTLPVTDTTFPPLPTTQFSPCHTRNMSPTLRNSLHYIVLHILVIETPTPNIFATTYLTLYATLTYTIVVLH